MKKSSLWKKFVILMLLIFVGIFNFNVLSDFYFRLTPYYSLTYAQDRELIRPYFDEEFYRLAYASDLQKTGEAPIDHFLRRSCRMGGGDHDPNDWFNVTIYKDRLWPCLGNPFVDFLRQPESLPSKDGPVVEVYANKDQLFRAWMAAEDFLRKKQFLVILVLPDNFKDRIPVRFHPMMKRGLQVRFSDDVALSFYKSPFLKSPEKYDCTDLLAQESPNSDQAVSRIRVDGGCDYLAHRLYKCTPWKKEGILNPCMLNFGFFCTEPIEFSAFGQTEEDFQKNMKRLAPGFDLLFLNSDIETPNLRIIPGYMATMVDEREISKEKIFGISFLLSLGGKNMSSFKTRGSFIYHFRKEIFDKEKEFTVPAQFFISRRDIKKYSKDLQIRAMPDDSKKWIFGTQFTIAIENSRQKHYFSEKSIDCFMALTVPIYIGCPNVTDYFDRRGLFIAKDPNDVIRIANSLTPETYAKMLPYLLENKRLAKIYMQMERVFIQEFFK
ncbi:MAG: hypothetical protein NTX76_05320 [Alphaproteobacteria bacterium]|nr:hypothetical protein [Alphaproteobacteria bacterium]